MKTKRTSRRRQVKHALANAIREASSPTYSQVREAKALARKLMGMPDLYSEKYLDKERRHLMKIARIVSDCAQFITFYSEERGALVAVHKKWLKKINASIEAANEYRKVNNFFFLGIPELKTLELDTISKSIKGLVVVLQCKTCNKYLSNRTERRHERCEECLDIHIESMAKELVRKSKQLTMAKALIKARKLEESLSSSPPSLSSYRLNPYNSTNTRGRMDMKHKNIANMQMPKRQEVSHR